MYINSSQRKGVPKLQDQLPIHKINRIDSHLAMIFSGIIANSCSLSDFEYTQKSGVRTFGLSCIIAGFD